MKRTLAVIGLASVLSCSLTGCDNMTNTQKGAVGGALAGAAIGGLAGGSVGAAALGGVIGAAGGAVIGSNVR